MKTKKLRNFDESDGLYGNLYNPNAVFLHSSGELLFGTPSSFCIVDPNIITENLTKPDVYISEFKINNIPITSGNYINLNALHLPNLKHITLKHTENSLTFSFIGNNYIKANKNKFK